MVIDKIGNVNSIIEPRKPKQNYQVNNVRPASDSVQISEEGLKAAEEARLAQIVKESPDIRADKVKELKEKIASGEFDRAIDEKLLGNIAERMIDGFFRNYFCLDELLKESGLCRFFCWNRLKPVSIISSRLSGGTV